MVELRNGQSIVNLIVTLTKSPHAVSPKRKREREKEKRKD